MGVPGFARQQVPVILRLVNAHGLFVGGEVEQGQQFVTVKVPPDAQDTVVVGFQGPHVRVAVKDRVVRPQILHLPQELENPSLPGGGVSALLRVLPGEVAPVDVPAVLHFQGVVVIAVVVELSDFVGRGRECRSG